MSLDAPRLHSLAETHFFPVQAQQSIAIARGTSAIESDAVQSLRSPRRPTLELSGLGWMGYPGIAAATELIVK